MVRRKQLNQTQKDDVEDYMSDDNWNELVPWFEAFDKANNEEKNYIRLLFQIKKN